jgi:hypothetical protein
MLRKSDDHGTAQGLVHPIKIEGSELVPFREDQHGISALDAGIGVGGGLFPHRESTSEHRITLERCYDGLL